MNELITSFRIESPPAWLEIGYDAENNWRAITINCEYWFNISENGVVVLMFKPSSKKPAYPLKIERDGNNIIWTPESAELVAGVGTMQAFFEVDGTTIGASKKIPCEVDGSLLGSASGGTPPWAIDMIEQIKDLTGHYPYVADNTLYVWDSINEEWIAFASGGGGGTVTVDDSLSETSMNPVQNRVIANALNQKGTYSKPTDGIPESDLASAVRTSLGKADSAYQKPSSGIQSSDLTQAIQNILSNAVLFSSQTRTDAEKEQARANIGAASISDLGTVFTLKGGVATVNDLPQTGNRIGDVWYVENVSAGFIWITSTAYPNGYWEELGETVNMSVYIEKPLNPVSDDALIWNGSAWIAKSIAPFEIQLVYNTATDEYFVPNAYSAQTIIDHARNCELIAGRDLYKLSRADKISAYEAVLYFVAETDGGADGYIIHALVGTDVITARVDNTSLPDRASASVGDFLVLGTGKIPEWKTVPSAENNSFGGGS